MEQKNDLEKLLVSYLLKELSAEEEAKVIKAINSDLGLFRYFEELKNVLMLIGIKQDIDGINLEEERKRFNEIYRLKPGTLPKIAPSLYDITGVEKPARFKIYKFLRAIAVAASVALILGIGWRMLRKNEVNDPVIVHKNTTIEETQKLFTKNELNVSGVTRHFMLKDGTQITLWDQSMITFEDPFSKNKRDINLSGKAGFKVAKDKTRPFTVYSGDITTTALGTEFIVTNFKKDQNIIVHLLEGQVVINSAENAKIKLKKPVYLLAGQELSYNKHTATVVIRNIRKNRSKQELATKENLVHDDPSVPKNNKGSWYMFNNQSLPQIFDQLEEMFKVEILYNRKDVEKLYFIGKFDKTDSLEYILKNITTINHLNLSKQNNKFLIHK
jgi:transmembrane sensor